MNWLFRWLGDKIKKSNDSVLEKSLWGNSVTSTRRGPFDNKLEDGMTFNIHRASGGIVVEHTHYDEKLDKNNQSLHIITDEQDLGEALARIVTIETLRR